MIKYKAFAVLIFISAIPAFPQKVTVVSPNNKIIVDLINRQNTDKGEWFLKVSYNDNNTTSVVIPEIILGLSRNDQDFSKDLKLLKSGKQVQIT
ncbi:MAG TPA: glycoside hydrolase family 97 protein, partial [Bacteroidales bacterium]|nr:glycoside hydrolase family 97 protein [Bacteroidales bacterium]